MFEDNQENMQLYEGEGEEDEDLDRDFGEYAQLSKS